MAPGRRRSILRHGMGKAGEAGAQIAATEQVPACLGVSETLARIGDKWSVLLVVLLSGGTKRFGDLKRLAPAISQRMLTLTLRGLERDGFVKRTYFTTMPPRVDYELTALGHSLSQPILALGDWALANAEQIRAARAEFDVRDPT